MRPILACAVFAAALLCRAQTVCIDPGHPSEVGRGTSGKKLSEMRAAWIEALLVKERLEKRGIRVVLTKSSESQLVRNKARAEKANSAKADLMLRLHCDSAVGSGFTAYYPSQPGRAEGRSGPSRTVISASYATAKRFHQAMAAKMGKALRDNGVKSDLATAVGRHQGALTGSVFSKVPVVLVEMVVLTNPKDEAFLTSRSGQKLMADALADGVVAALRKSPPSGAGSPAMGTKRRTL